MKHLPRWREYTARRNPAEGRRQGHRKPEGRCTARRTCCLGVALAGRGSGRGRNYKSAIDQNKARYSEETTRSSEIRNRSLEGKKQPWAGSTKDRKATREEARTTIGAARSQVVCVLVAEPLPPRLDISIIVQGDH